MKVHEKKRLLSPRSHSSALEIVGNILPRLQVLLSYCPFRSGSFQGRWLHALASTVANAIEAANEAPRHISSRETDSRNRLRNDNLHFSCTQCTLWPLVSSECGAPCWRTEIIAFSRPDLDSTRRPLQPRRSGVRFPGHTISLLHVQLICHWLDPKRPQLRLKTFKTLARGHTLN